MNQQTSCEEDERREIFGWWKVSDRFGWQVQKGLNFNSSPTKNFIGVWQPEKPSSCSRSPTSLFFDEIKTLFLKRLKKLQNLIFKRRDEVELVQFYNNYIELALNGFKALLKRAINCQFPAKHSWEARADPREIKKGCQNSFWTFFLERFIDLLIFQVARSSTAAPQTDMMCEKDIFIYNLSSRQATTTARHAVRTRLWATCWPSLSDARARPYFMQ